MGRSDDIAYTYGDTVDANCDFEDQPRLKVAPQSVIRLKDRLRELFRAGRGRSVGHTVKEMSPILRGWLTYFRNVDVKVTFEELDQWIRRKMRCILWRQWKRPKARLRELIARGLTPDRAKASSVNGRGPWWNAGASHMNQAVPTAVLRQLGLVSLIQEHRRLARSP